MRSLAVLTSIALLAAAPAAQAASFVSGPGTVSLDRGDDFTWTTDFAGASGAAAKITFNFLTANAAGTAWNFSYSLDNTSVAPSLSSRIGVFGFDTTGTPTSVMAGQTDLFQGTGGGNFNGLGNRDVCLFAGQNCNGSGNSGITVSQSPVGGTFTLNFANGLNTLTLDSFAARWQAAGANANLSLSAPGTVVTAVPEPATWALMMLGFAVIGYAMRRRSAVRFAHA